MSDDNTENEGADEAAETQDAPRQDVRNASKTDKGRAEALQTCTDIVKAELDKSKAKLPTQIGKSLDVVRGILARRVRFLEGEGGAQTEIDIPARMAPDIVNALKGLKSADAVKAQVASQKPAKREAPLTKGARKGGK